MTFHSLKLQGQLLINVLLLLNNHGQLLNLTEQLSILHPQLSHIFLQLPYISWANAILHVLKAGDIETGAESIHIAHYIPLTLILVAFLEEKIDAFLHNSSLFVEFTCILRTGWRPQRPVMVLFHHIRHADVIWRRYNYRTLVFEVARSLIELLETLVLVGFIARLQFWSWSILRLLLRLVHRWILTI